LWCRYVPDAQVVPPRVAFSIGRKVGTAVARNRLRRRLRAAVRSVAGTSRLANGWLLVGARPAALEQSFATLVAELDAMLSTVAPATASGAGHRGHE
jgi:ribonuclease P protein component